MTASVLGQDAFLFEIKPQVQRVTGGIGNYRLLGDSHLSTPNEPNAVTVHYFLKEKAKDKVKLTVTDPYGKVLRELSGGGEAGMNTVLWDMRAVNPAVQGARGGRGFGGGSIVDPGEYVVTLEVDGKKLVKKAVIPRRMGWSIGPFPYEIHGHAGGGGADLRTGICPERQEHDRPVRHQGHGDGNPGDQDHQIAGPPTRTPA
jgi:hypothetical protein